jgi:hypothetical protein
MGKSRFLRRNYGKISFFGGGIIITKNKCGGVMGNYRFLRAELYQPKIYLGGIITTSKNFGGIITTYAKIEWRNYYNIW